MSIISEELFTYVGLYPELKKWRKRLGDISITSCAERHFLITDWWYHYSVDLSSELPDEFIISLTNRFAQLLVIINVELEGADYQNFLKPSCDRLLRLGVPKQNILIWGNIDQTPDCDIACVNTLGGLGIGITVAKHVVATQRTHHFIMLAAQPRPLRLLMASEILIRKLDLYGHISCGAVKTNWDWRQHYARFIHESVRDRFPLMLDGFIESMDLRQYETVDPRINGATINIICETSQDAGLETTNWIKPWLNEKTTKCFLLGQIPLVVGVPGTVTLIRQLGFDVFDDLIDHSYDDVLDPQTRVAMVAEQLADLCLNYKPQELHDTHTDRLRYNRELIEHKLKTLFETQCTKLNKWLESLQNVDQIREV